MKLDGVDIIKKWKRLINQQFFLVNFVNLSTFQLTSIFLIFATHFKNTIVMDFQLTEEHLMIQQAARDFAVNECLPGVIERDELQRFPKEQVEKLADLGFMGMMVKTEYGGSGMDTVSYVLAMEEISKVDASVSVCMSVNNSLVCYGLQEYGNEDQKEKILNAPRAGEKRR